MSVTTPSTGQKISDFSVGTVDSDSYLIQARNGSTSKVSATQIGQYSNLNLLFSGTGGLDTTNKTIIGAINEVNAKDASDIAYDNTSSGLTATDVNAAIDEVKEDIDEINTTANPLFYWKAFSAEVTVNAGGGLAVTRTQLGMTDDIPTGYDRVGIVLCQSNNNNVMIGSFSATAASNILRVYNTSSANQTATLAIRVLYIKSGFMSQYT